jgi:hypothetical protein
MPSKHDKKEPVMDRRQFLVKTAATCGLAAGAGVWGYVFYSDKPVRRREEKIYTLKDFSVEENPAYAKLAIVHGKAVERMTIRAS